MILGACAAYKAGVVLSDPYETEDGARGSTSGNTFAHVTEAGSATGSPTRGGRAGLLAALRLSGQPTDAGRGAQPQPVEADLDVA